MYGYTMAFFGFSPREKYSVTNTLSACSLRFSLIYSLVICLFQTRNRETVVEELEEGFAAPNREETLKRIDENLDFEEIAEMVSFYETALNNWCKVWDAIAERQRDGSAGRKAYRDMTKRVYKRFYNDLSELKELHW